MDFGQYKSRDETERLGQGGCQMDADADEDWYLYKVKRNLCTKLQKADKAEFIRNTYSRLEADRDIASIHATTRDLLGIHKAGPPSCFQLAGWTIRKHQDLAEAQMKYYLDKITDKRNSLPKVNLDPLQYLRQAHLRWHPAGRKPKFQLKTVTINIK